MNRPAGPPRHRAGVRLLGSVALVAALHLAFVIATAAHAVPVSRDHFDARQYREIADAVRAGEGFQLTRDDGRGPDLDRTPGYPLFVALFGGGWGAVPSVLLAQHLLVLVTAGITWLWARRLERPWSALVAFLLVGADLTSMTYASYLLTESLFTLFLTSALALWPLARDRHTRIRACAAGAAWGLATLTRPITFYLAPLAVLGSLALRRGGTGAWRRVLWAVLAGSLVVAPWLVRNRLLSGRFVLSTIEGENLLYYRAALVSLPAGASVDDWRDTLRARLNEGAFDRSDPRQAAALDRLRKHEAFDLMLSHPLGLARPLMMGLPRLFLSPNRSYLYALLGVEHADWDLESLGAGSLLDAIARGEVLYLGTSFLYELVIVVLAGIGIVAAWRRREAWLVAPLIVLVYVALLSAGLETHARFRVPLVPILALFAARGLAQCLEWRRRTGAPAPGPEPG